MKQKAVGHLHITLDQINKLFEKGGKAGVADHAEQGDPDDTFIDLYVALVSQPSIGKSLLGKDGWAHLQKRLKPGQQAVLVAGEGRYSWKGSGYVRGGIFDRIEMIQGRTASVLPMPNTNASSSCLPPMRRVLKKFLGLPSLKA